MSKIMKFSFVLFIIIIIGGVAFLTQGKGELITPLHDDAFVKAWATDAIQDIMKFDFSNTEVHFKNAKQYFTKDGYEGFYMALKGAGAIEAAKTHKLKVSTKFLSPPVLCQKRIRNGHYIWVIDTRSELSYSSDTKVSRENHSISLIVVRSDESQNKDKIAINQWLAYKAKPDEPFCKDVNDSIDTEDFFATLPIFLKIKVTTYMKNKMDSGTFDEAGYDRCKIPDYLSEELRNEVRKVTSLDYCRE